MLIRKRGKIEVNNTNDFKWGIGYLLMENIKVVFDMTELEFFDSSGCGVLLSCLGKLNAKVGDIKLFGLTKSDRTLFELIRMHRIFDIFNTKEEAVKAYQL